MDVASPVSAISTMVGAASEHRGRFTGNRYDHRTADKPREFEIES